MRKKEPPKPPLIVQGLDLEPPGFWKPPQEPENSFYTIRHYCSKHAKCSEVCRLFDEEEQHCFFWDVDAGPPCDWKLPPREEDEK